MTDVVQVSDKGHVRTIVLNRPDKMNARAPLANRLTKRGITRATAIDLEDHLRYELANIRRAFASEDAAEARRAFFEKRTPLFRGR